MFYAENDSIDKTDPNGLESAEISLYSAQVETQGRSPDPESLPGAHSLDTPGKQKAAGAIGMAILNPRAGAWGGGAALTFSVAGQLYSKGTVSLSTTVDDTENGIYTSVAGGAGGRILGPVAGKLGSIAGKLGKAVGTGSGAYTGAKVAEKMKRMHVRQLWAQRSVRSFLTQKVLKALSQLLVDSF